MKCNSSSVYTNPSDSNYLNSNKMRGVSKRHRTHFTNKQVEKLEEIFSHTPHPYTELADHLSSTLHLTQKNIWIWFKNRRAKEKRQNKTVIQRKIHTSNSENSKVQQVKVKETDDLEKGEAEDNEKKDNEVEAGSEKLEPIDYYPQNPVSYNNQIESDHIPTPYFNYYHPHDYTSRSYDYCYSMADNNFYSQQTPAPSFESIPPLVSVSNILNTSEHGYADSVTRAAGDFNHVHGQSNVTAFNIDPPLLANSSTNSFADSSDMPSGHIYTRPVQCWSEHTPNTDALDLTVRPSRL